MKIVKRILQILFILGFIIIIFAFTKKVNINIKAYKGNLNLSNWNFNKNGKVRLQGQWKLYYGQLLTPNDIEKKDTNKYYNIPGKLKDQVKGKTQGYMTLHLKIDVPKDEVYGIYINSLFTSSDVWVNGIHLSGHGKVGQDIKTEKAIYRPQCISFRSINKKIDIVIHTSTYRDIEPSIRAATLGTKQQIMNIVYRNTSIDGLIIGIMFIMGILNFGFYFTKPRQKRNLYFTSICFTMLVRCLVFNSRLLVQFYPYMYYEVLSKIAAITFYLCVTLYILFLNDVFKNTLKIKKMAIAFGIGFTVLCVVTNNRVYDAIAIYVQGIVGFFMLYVCVFMVKGIYGKNKNAEKNIFPFVVICITTLNDILVNNSIWYNAYIIHYGIIVFIISQSIFIVSDYLEANRKIHKINRDGLTSLYNNKYIKQLLLSQLIKYSQKNEKFSLIMVDIDDFKSINDTCGHMFGDTVIVDVANVLKEVVEDKGYVGRYGGDEFIIILPKIIERESSIIAKDIMYKIKEVNDKYDINSEISLSIGVYENEVNDLKQCIDKVDCLLYKAKLSGKNCIK